MKPGKTARRRSREIALQALYAWQLGRGDALEVFRTGLVENFERATIEARERPNHGVVDLPRPLAATEDQEP